MSFANSSVQNTFRPDTRVLDSIAALAARIEVLEAEKLLVRAENADLRLRLQALQLWASTLVLYEDD